MEGTLGEVIRRLRKSSRMTMQELALKSGTCPSQIHGMEKGYKVPEPSVLEAMLRTMKQEDAIPEILPRAARERGSVTLDLTAVDFEAVQLSIELARAYRNGLSGPAAAKLRKALAAAS